MSGMKLCEISRAPVKGKRGSNQRDRANGTRAFQKGHPMTNWPTFTLVHLPNELDDSVPDDVRMAANDLTRQGVPKALLRHRYQVDEKITHVVVNQKNFLRFGSTIGVSSMCMDVATGSIVILRGTAVGFVSSSLEKFIETVKAVTARFPFYSEKDVLVEEVVDQAVKDVMDAIRSVDERALEQDGFWTTLVDDIQMGDFATEWTVSQHDTRGLILEHGDDGIMRPWQKRR